MSLDLIFVVISVDLFLENIWHVKVAKIVCHEVLIFGHFFGLNASAVHHTSGPSPWRDFLVLDADCRLTKLNY